MQQQQKRVNENHVQKEKFALWGKLKVKEL